MFATLQKSKAEQITPETSLRVTENLLSSLISELCFVRNIFDETAFAKRKFGKTQFHALVKEQNNDVDKLLKWLEEGAFDALRANYLAMIVLGIYTNENDPSKFTEAWYFKVNAGGGIDVEKSDSGGERTSAPSTPGGQRNFLVGTTKSAVKEITQNFVRTVVALKGGLDPLPEERFLSMRLYYKASTPEEYHPNGFACMEDCGIFDTSIRYAQTPVSLSLGQSATPYHGLQLRVKTVIDNQDQEENNNQHEAETQYVERGDMEMDEMWRESDDSDSDDERSEAASEVNPGHGSGDEDSSEGNDLRRCLMLVAAKASHEKLFEQELLDLLECSNASLNFVVTQLRDLKVLLRRSGPAFEISQGTALQILEERFDQGPPLTQMQRSPPRASPAETEIMPTPEYPPPKPFGFSARVYGARGEDKPTAHTNEETHENDETQDSQNPDEDIAGLTNGFNNAVSLSDNPASERLAKRNRPRRYGAAGRTAQQSLAAVRERSTAIAAASTPLAKTAGTRPRRARAARSGQA